MPRKHPVKHESESEEELEEESPAGFNFDFGTQIAAIKAEEKKFFDSLPVKVQSRIKVLRKIQGDYEKLEDKFEEELRQLELKYAALYKPLFMRRSEIVTGASDVTEQEVASAKTFEEEEKKKETKEGETAETAAPGATETTTVTPSTEEVAGVPKFWLTVLKKSEIYDEMVQKWDEPALEYLEDIVIDHIEIDNGADQPKTRGFKLSFSFKDNPFFNNKVLVKTYLLSPEDNQTIEKSEGTNIDWKSEDKDLTVEFKTKKQKHKSGKHTRKVKTQVPRDSFFNFFKKLEFVVQQDEDEEDAENRYEELLDADASIGAEFRDKIIPHAVQYFLGEMLQLDMGKMMQGLDIGEDEFEELPEDEEEEEEKPKKKGGKKGGKKELPAPPKGSEGPENPECKQQ